MMLWPFDLKHHSFQILIPLLNILVICCHSLRWGIQQLEMAKQQQLYLMKKTLFISDLIFEVVPQVIDDGLDSNAR
jgi:hypothetical protein